MACCTWSRARQIGAERPVHRLQIAGRDVVDVVVARPADAPLHDLEPLAVDLAGGEDEAEQLVGGLGPAVPVVRARRHLRRHHVEPPRPDEPLVVVGGVVRAARHHAAHALLERGPVHVVGQRHVGVLRLKLGVAVVLPGRGVEPRRADEAAVDDGIGAREVLPVLVPIGAGEVGDDDPGDLHAVARRVADVDRDQVPAVGQLLPHALGDVARRPRHHDASLGHGHLRCARPSSSARDIASPRPSPAASPHRSARGRRRRA